jgi:hypothetical protein
MAVSEGKHSALNSLHDAAMCSILNASQQSSNDTSKGIKTMSEEDRNALIVQWREAQRQLNIFKDAEATLRAQIVATYFDPAKEKGTEHLQLGEGYKLTCVKKLTAKIDRSRIDEKLNEIETVNAEAKFIADRLFKWNPELSTTEWNDVSERAEGGNETCQKIMEILIGGPKDIPVVTFAPGMPSLTFVEPKAK